MDKLICVTGLPLAGKTTIAYQLKDSLGRDGKVVSIGGLMRASMDNLPDWLKNGDFAPETEMQRIVTKECEKLGQYPYLILEGAPRQKSQIAWLKNLAEQLDRELYFIVVEADTKELQVRSINRNRYDKEYDKGRIIKHAPLMLKVSNEILNLSHQNKYECSFINTSDMTKNDIDSHIYKIGYKLTNQL